MKLILPQTAKIHDKKELLLELKNIKFKDLDKKKMFKNEDKRYLVISQHG